MGQWPIERFPIRASSTNNRKFKLRDGLGPLNWASEAILSFQRGSVAPMMLQSSPDLRGPSNQGQGRLHRAAEAPQVATGLFGSERSRSGC